MAGDWIKMRMDLSTSPKVVRIASALRADRLRVVGGLHAVWCLFDMHSEDGRLDGYTLDALDDLIGFDGFGAAMVSVGWLEDAGDFLQTPRFDEHNGQSAKRRAMETERKRESRKVSAPDADKKRSREEKRREDIEDKSSIPPYPQGLDVQAWERWVVYRKQIGKSLKPASTPSAQLSLAKHGDDQAAVVEQSVANGWQGLFPLKTPNATGQPKGAQSFRERDEAAKRKAYEERTGRKWPESEDLHDEPRTIDVTPKFLEIEQ